MQVSFLYFTYELQSVRSIYLIFIWSHSIAPLWMKSFCLTFLFHSSLNFLICISRRQSQIIGYPLSVCCFGMTLYWWRMSSKLEFIWT